MGDVASKQAAASPGVTETGHVIGAVYRSDYWGGTYLVVGPAAASYGAWRVDGVEVECVTPGGGAHQTPGERWVHMTDVGKDVIVGTSGSS